MPMNAPWASDSWPVRPTSTSRARAAMAVAITPTKIDSWTPLTPGSAGASTITAAPARPAMTRGLSALGGGSFTEQTLRTDEQDDEHRGEHCDRLRLRRDIGADHRLEYADDDAADDRTPHRIEPA